MFKYKLLMSSKGFYDLTDMVNDYLAEDCYGVLLGSPFVFNNNFYQAVEKNILDNMSFL